MNEKIKAINEIFEGLEFDYIKYNSKYNDFEVHFKGGKYFCLGVKVVADVRQERSYFASDMLTFKG